MKKNPFQQTEGCKPEIEYPCLWQYKIIGSQPEHIREAVAAVVRDASHLLTDSNTSSGGRYCSLNLELVVQSEEERLALYQQLVEHKAIKIVL
ncbi:HP0495 family protein [Desulfogranum mediterraneum]|uniref:HP0495 family protein n=1 Tax=Desulfogranum mediterraneum TaxID=160661 RepID=UPI0004261896|nr:DUF493 domain-containing protein [Desulfogranum mediterraneum]